MKIWLFTAAILALVAPTFALDGQIQIHDPSTIVQCDGKFYTYGTGGTCLLSDDGWTWHRGTPPARRGMAPDIIHLGDRYYRKGSEMNIGTFVWLGNPWSSARKLRIEYEGAIYHSDEPR